MYDILNFGEPEYRIWWYGHDCVENLSKFYMTCPSTNVNMSITRIESNILKNLILHDGNEFSFFDLMN